MLDRLPTELLLDIAELAAPQMAYSRHRLFVVRRSWFASLASISRFLWQRLHPLIWTEIWLFETWSAHLPEGSNAIRPLRRSRSVSFCILEADTLEEIGRVLPRFRSVTSVDIMGSGTNVAPLQLSVLERLPSGLIHLNACRLAYRLRRQ